MTESEKSFRSIIREIATPMLEAQINEIGGAVHMLFQDVQYIKQALYGTENLILHLSEFVGKREEFEKFIEEKIKERQEADKKAQKEKEQAVMEKEEKNI